MIQKLNENNFLVYAMNHYDNPQCHSVQEFEEDLKRFLYLKKLFHRYKNKEELRERLILNHIIVLYNIFGDSTTNMLFYKIDEDSWQALTTFLTYLGRMPDKVPEHNIIASDISMDTDVITRLRKI